MGTRVKVLFVRLFFFWVFLGFFWASWLFRD
jgi:hypothetical protein